MDEWLTGIIGGAYVAGLLGAYRLHVRGMIRKADGWRALTWLDWDALVAGLLPGVDLFSLPPSQAVLPDGAPAPRWWGAPLSGEAARRRAVLIELVEGATRNVIAELAPKAGFRPGEVHWLEILADARLRPDKALADLKKARPSDAAGVYLLEHLRLTRALNTFNLEWVVMTARRRLDGALERLGPRAELFYARALAFARLGRNGVVVDELARAVYFSHEAPFYLQVVLRSPHVRETRPTLTLQCEAALTRQRDVA